METVCQYNVFYEADSGIMFFWYKQNGKVTKANSREWRAGISDPVGSGVRPGGLKMLACILAKLQPRHRLKHMTNATVWERNQQSQPIRDGALQALRVH